jgi:hypothetical protein
MTAGQKINPGKNFLFIAFSVGAWYDVVKRTIKSGFHLTC